LRKELVFLSRLPDFALWNKIGNKRIPLSFELEITPRCNNNCRHCYINLPPGDKASQRNELTADEISAIADQATALGSLWCVITGGEPLIREDFIEIYMLLKRKGLLVSVFTNACLVTDEHIKLFRNYPPRDIEVTVYGAGRKTYEKVTGIPGSYDCFRRGLNLLAKGGIKVNLKAMAIRSNMHELKAIADFCRKSTKEFFRFDPFLHLRFDGNRRRNENIMAERLSPGEIIAAEQADPERLQAIIKQCSLVELPDTFQKPDSRLFQCSAGQESFAVSHNGLFHPCLSLRHEDCIFDLRRGSLAEAWFEFTPRMLERTTDNSSFLKKCGLCPLMNLCQWCPAVAYLETGRMDQWCEHFCRTARERAGAFGQERI
jgi:radical SAM protein with 4Fe4S-binding SPASM domain